MTKKRQKKPTSHAATRDHNAKPPAPRATRTRMAPRRSKGPADETAAAASPKARAGRPPKEDEAKVTKPKGTGRRGRPPMDPALRKTVAYVPTGRPRGRPPKDPSQKKSATAATKAKPKGAAGPGRRGRKPGPAAAAKAAKTAKGGPKRSRKSGGATDEEEEEEEEEEDVVEEDGEADDVNGDEADEDLDAGES